MSLSSRWVETSCNRKPYPAPLELPFSTSTIHDLLAHHHHMNLLSSYSSFPSGCTLVDAPCVLLSVKIDVGVSASSTGASFSWTTTIHRPQ